MASSSSEIIASNGSEDDDDPKACTIKYKKEEKTIKITEELTPQYLATEFGLISIPEFLTSGKKGRRLKCNPGKSIKASPGTMYTIPDQDYFDEDKEHVWNAFYCSKAAYEEDPHSFLQNNLRLHNIDSVGVSIRGNQKIVIGGCSHKKTLYVAYRGSVTKEDWETNARISLSTRNNYPGKCHAGFSERADELPASYIVKYATEHDLSTIVTCGHSLGGAVSSVTCLNLLSFPITQEVANLKMFNITFAAPYFCDTQLSNYCQEHKFSNRFFHYVNDLDIVPTLLSVSNTIDDVQRLLPSMSISSEAKATIERWFPVFSQLGGIVVKGVLPSLASEFVDNFLPILGKLVEEKFNLNLGDGALDKDIHDYKPMGNYRFLKKKVHYIGDESEVVQMLLGIATSMKTNADFTQAFKAHVLENYEKKMEIMRKEPYMLSKECQVIKDIFFPRIDKMEIVWENAGEENQGKCWLSITGEFIHNIDLQTCRFPLTSNFSFNEINYEIKKFEDNQKEIIHIEKKVNKTEKANIENQMNMSDMGIKFTMSTTFGETNFTLEKYMIRKMKIRSVEELAENVLVADLLRRGIQRSIAINSIRKSSSSGSIGWSEENNILLREIQSLIDSICESRQYDLSQYVLSTCTQNSPVEDLIKQVESFFDKPIHKVIENKFKKPLLYLAVGGLFVALGGVARVTNLSKTATAAAAASASSAAAAKSAEAVAAKLADTATKVAGASEYFVRKAVTATDQTLFDYLVAGASIFGEVVVNAKAETAEATAVAAVEVATSAAAASIAATTAAAATTAPWVSAFFGLTGLLAGIPGQLMKDVEHKAVIEAKYLQTLEWYLEELRKIQGELELCPEEKIDLSDLAFYETPYAKEAMIVRLWQFWKRKNPQDELKLPSSILDNFSKDDNVKVQEEKRLHYIESVHKIRVLFGSQCYVGFTGYEDSGKSTLLQKIFEKDPTLLNEDIETGYTNHTSKVNLYPIDDRLIFVDYPGTKGLHDHAEAFRNCGPMNNLIFFLMPFTGEPKEDTYQEIMNAFLIMAASSSAQIFFCMNKCGAVIEDITEEMKKECTDPKDTPFGKFRERFVDKLNRRKLSEEKEMKKECTDPKETLNGKKPSEENLPMAFEIDKNNFLFTDWKMGDTEEAKAAGIVGPNGIIDHIKEFLTKKRVYEGREEKIPSILNISS